VLQVSFEGLLETYCVTLAGLCSEVLYLWRQLYAKQTSLACFKAGVVEFWHLVSYVGSITGQLLFCFSWATISLPNLRLSLSYSSSKKCR